MTLLESRITVLALPIGSADSFISPLLQELPKDVKTAITDFAQLASVTRAESRYLVAAYLEEQLQKLDTPELTSIPMWMRGHHGDSRKYLLELAESEGIIVGDVGMEVFFQSGIVSDEKDPKINKRLYKFIVEKQLEYFDDLLKNPTTYDSDHGSMSYRNDQYGNTAEENTQWLLKNNFVNLRWFRQLGDSPLFYTALLDDTCWACVRGAHCTWNMRSGINGEIYNPEEIEFLNWYLDNFEPLSGKEDGQQPKVIKSELLHITREGSEYEVVIPVVIATTVGDFRHIIWKKTNPLEPNYQK